MFVEKLNAPFLRKNMKITYDTFNNYSNLQISDGRMSSSDYRDVLPIHGGCNDSNANGRRNLREISATD